MRTTIAVLACLGLLAACGGVDTEAIKAQIKDLDKKIAAANAEKYELLEKNGPLKTTSYKAMARYTAAKKSGDEDRIAAAKQASDEAAATVQQALDAETAIDARIRKLKDKRKKLERKLR